MKKPAREFHACQGGDISYGIERHRRWARFTERPTHQSYYMSDQPSEEDGIVTEVLKGTLAAECYK